MLKIFFTILFIFSYSFSSPLQDAIDKSSPNSILKLSPGTYEGNIIINKKLTIEAAKDGVIIKGDKEGSVVTITSSGVILKNLKIINSGLNLHNQDAAIKINKAKNIEINSCIIEKSLYGIVTSMMNNSKIINNNISSFKNTKISLRGDALKLYYSHNNLIQNNIIKNSRDVTISYSHNNIISQNHTEFSHYALFIDLSNDNIIDENHYEFNTVGIIFMGAKNTKITNNIITKSFGAASMGVLIKGVSEFVFENNIVSYNTKGIYIDAKHNETNIKRFINNNEISYNKEAITFHGAIKQNKITNNVIVGNIDDVIKGVRGNFTSQNIVKNNYWDNYAGFDINGDNIGDSSYKIFQYADRLWHYNNKIKYFYASPVISMLNFLLQIAPFIEPIVLLEDTAPLVDLKAK